MANTRLEPRDLNFARSIVMCVLRRLAQIDQVLAEFLSSPLPPRSGSAETILRMVAAETCFLGVPGHASVNSAVILAAEDPKARHFKGLVNAVARRVAENGAAITATQSVSLNVPAWAWARWVDEFGEPTAQQIAEAHVHEPPLDITTKNLQKSWQDVLEAQLLPTGSLRLERAGRIEDLSGFADGEWWVQDAAAALPVQLMGDIAGQTIIDLCAAPGGKTMQLAARGAKVVAIESDHERADRIGQNLTRTKLSAEIIVADANMWRPILLADAVMLDAPCSATGTARRHPDVLLRKDLSDVLAQSAIQLRLLHAATEMVKPGGMIIYCVCSLMKEEGPEIVTEFLKAHPNFERVPVQPSEVADQSGFISAEGDLRTLPSHWKEWGGLDGFYACRLMRKNEFE